MTVNKTVKSTLARLLAQEDIHVEHRGVRTAGFNLKTRVLTLPVWDAMSPAMYDYMTAHEVGHALETPTSGWMEAVERRKALKGYLNVIEDVRIEKIMRRRYPGLKKDFTAAYVELYQRNFFGDDAPHKPLLIDRINCYYKGGTMMGINFTAEEAVLRDRVGTVNTWEQVEELALEILEFAKANKTPEPEIEEESGTEEKVEYVPVPEEFSEEESESGEESEEDAEGEESESEEDAEGEESEEDAESGEESEEDAEGEESEEDAEGGETDSEEGNDSGSDELSDDEVESETDELLQKMLEETFGSSRERFHLQININPKVKNIENRVVSYDTILRDIADENVYVNIEPELESLMSDFNKENKAIINHMVREFEMKKRAAEYSRTATSKTGIIDCSKLHMYKYSDDVFARMDVTPDGKNHGMIMYVDWSGSMSSSLHNVVEQLINMVAFCRQAGIAHRVFAFTDDSGARTSLRQQQKSELEIADCELDVNKASLLELFNSNMNKLKYSRMSKYLLAYSSEISRSQRRGYWRSGGSRSKFGMPSKYTLNGTPLTEALVLSFPMFDKFKSDSRADVITTLWLTDGGGCDPLYRDPATKSSLPMSQSAKRPRDEEGRLMPLRTTVTNLVNKESIVLPDYATNADGICEALRSMYISYTDSNLLGYFVVGSTLAQFQRHIPAIVKKKFGGGYSPEFEAYAKKCAKEGLCVTKDTSYTEYYLISSDKLKTESDNFDSIPEGATTRKIASVYKKMSNKKNSSRVFASKMMELVA